MGARKSTNKANHLRASSWPSQSLRIMKLHMGRSAYSALGPPASRVTRGLHAETVKCLRKVCFRFQHNGSPDAQVQYLSNIDCLVCTFYTRCIKVLRGRAIRKVSPKGDQRLDQGCNAGTGEMHDPGAGEESSLQKVVDTSHSGLACTLPHCCDMGAGMKPIRPRQPSSCRNKP